MFPDDSGKVEHGGLEEENEDHPLVILVVDHLLPRFDRCYTRMWMISSNLVWKTLPILLANFPPPRYSIFKL